MNIYQLKEYITSVIESNKTVSEKLKLICDFLNREIEYYDWVGFYFKNGEKKELKLAEFSGEPTEHIIIPFGKGICGQVAISNKNFVVSNVEDQDNYISCGFNVKSEIVIPIIVNGKNIGQIDIDSHTVNPFSKNDELLLEFVCEKVAAIV
ncbi:MAG: histidine kinase [Lutibacter sp.]|nr:MAG: histidine kinase [Lutibacter sp.]